MFHVKHLRRRLSSEQSDALEAYAEALQRFNRQVNLVSRPSAGRVLTDHIYPCLALAMKSFPADTTVVDWGSGGGLPAIPLAILFPHTQFVAVDAVRKKALAVRQFGRSLNLMNLRVWCGRAHAYPYAIHYSVSRATAPLQTLWAWHSRCAVAVDVAVDAAHWTPGLLCLKGGNLSEEHARLSRRFPDTKVSTLPVDGSDRVVLHVQG